RDTVLRDGSRSALRSGISIRYPRIRNKDASPVVLNSRRSLYSPGRPNSTSREGTVARVRNRTERDNEDLVRLYLEDIGRHQLLTKDDEARLAQDIEAGKA